MINFERLKNLREDNDISQEKMSTILKVNRSTYSLWELGINIIPIKNLIDFCDYFNVNIDYVLSLTNKKTTKFSKPGLDIKKLGENMKNIRIKNNLSQDYVATILNVTQPAIARYEKGLVFISLTNLYKFSKEFNISINYLCGKE